MVEGSGRGQLRAWQGSGEGSGTEVRVGFWSILVIFGHFWDPVQNLKILVMAQGPLKKMALRQGILTRIWTGGSFWGQKFD